ncbi:MAG: outer membrane lipoprotein carrier protein LolA [Rhodospirillales bacterium]|nr:outer membrane lipoprotein carrier protein LolA [Rhodospirillales bacterium]
MARPAALAAQPAAATLSAADSADVARIERYFNAVRTLKARFLQIASTGQTAEGDVWLKRPGRMRIAYDPPVPILIVADGTWLIYSDRELGQVSYLPLGSTPAGILVENEIRLKGGNLTITGFEHEAGVIRITLVRTASPGDGSLTLVFSDNPLQLRQWRVVDAQGVVTTVSLSDVRTGVSLGSDLFEFVDPRHAPPAYPQ